MPALKLLQYPALLQHPAHSCRSLFEVFSYFLSFSFRHLGAWLTIKQKMHSLSLSSWYNSIFTQDGLFFLSFPSHALFKGLVTVETAFFLFDIAAFRIRRKTGPSIRLGDQFSSQFHKHIFSAHMPRHLPDILPAHRPRPKLTFPFHYSFLFSSCHVAFFIKIVFFLYTLFSLFIFSLIIISLTFSFFSLIIFFISFPNFISHTIFGYLTSPLHYPSFSFPNFISHTIFGYLTSPLHYPSFSFPNFISHTIFGYLTSLFIIHLSLFLTFYISHTIFWISYLPLFIIHLSLFLTLSLTLSLDILPPLFIIHLSLFLTLSLTLSLDILPPLHYPSFSFPNFYLSHYLWISLPPLSLSIFLFS
ncbi:unnamed protein product [Acanthosepion pharaonis]|uniref:Uncharacterized protein n=1 Tax=Acanthosepion pharaonis TaxID=158019 RepID=A0A812CBD2_ACAPH|nr:unnamed protein product [Sepia pharaonis]